MFGQSLHHAILAIEVGLYHRLISSKEPRCILRIGCDFPGFDPFGANVLHGQCDLGGWRQPNELAPAGDSGCLLSGLAQLDDLDYLWFAPP